MIRRCIHLAGYLLALFTPLVVNPWVALPFEPAKVAFVRWVIVLLLLAVSVGALGLRRSSWALWGSLWRRQDWLCAAALLYGLATLLTMFTSLDPVQSWWGNSDKHGVLTTGCCLLLFGLLRLAIRTPRQVAYHLLALVAGSVPVCTYALVQASGYDPLSWHTDSVSPVLSTLGRSNIVGAYLAVVIPLTLHLAWISWFAPGRRAVAGVGIILLLQYLCLVLTQARAGWLAFLGGVAVWWWYVPLKQTRQQRLIGLLVFGLTTVGIFGGFERLGAESPVAPAQVEPKHAFVERRTAAVEHRFIIWQHTLPLITERWLLGYGPEMFGVVFNQRYPPGSLYVGTDILVDDPHNLLLEQMMASGLVGVLAWLGLLLLFYRQTYPLTQQALTPEARGLAAALLGSMSAYVIQAQLNPDTIVLTLCFWLLLTYCNGLSSA
jgi:O-antigen ligase